MTLHNASTITQLFIITRDRGTHWAAIGCRENDPSWLIYGKGANESEALQALVDENYRQVCRVVALRQGWRCYGCGQPKALQFHHKKLRAQGRLDTEDNLRGACQDCHDADHHIYRSRPSPLVGVDIT